MILIDITSRNIRKSEITFKHFCSVMQMYPSSKNCTATLNCKVKEFIEDIMQDDVNCFVFILQVAYRLFWGGGFSFNDLEN